MTDNNYILPGDEIPVSNEFRRKLGSRLRDAVGAMEAAHSETARKLDVWWKLYDGAPKHERRSDPFPDSSNVMVNLVRIHGDALTARAFNSVFASQDLWIERVAAEELKDLPHQWVTFLNRAADDNEFEMTRPCLDAFREDIVCGSSVLSLQWGKKIRHVIDPGSVRPGRKPKTIPVTTHDGPVIAWIPRRQIMWQPGRNLETSEIVVRQCTMSWADISRQVQYGSWNETEANAIREGSHYNPSWSLSSRMGDSRLQYWSGPKEFRPYDMREVWVDLHMVKSFGLESEMPWADNLVAPALLIAMDRDSGRVLSVKAKPYATAGWPFYEFNFRGSGTEGYEKGVAGMLEHMQAAATTLLNQAIDAITLSNSINLLTNHKDLLDKKIRPNLPLYVPGDISETAVRLINLPKVIQPDMLLMNLVFGISERLTGATDPAFGKENRQGGHPSPATSTLTLLRQAQETLRVTLKLIRRQFGLLAEDILTLYQQFASDDEGRFSRLVGAGDARKIMQLVFPQGQTVGQLAHFDVRALSEELNPEEARSRAAFIDQATTNYYSRLIQATQLIAQAQQQGQQAMIPVVKQFMSAMTESYKTILQSSDVDEIEKFVLEIQNDQSPALLDRLQGALASGFGEVAGSAPGPAIPAGLPGLAAEGNGQAARLPPNGAAGLQ